MDAIDYIQFSQIGGIVADLDVQTLPTPGVPSLLNNAKERAIGNATGVLSTVGGAESVGALPGNHQGVATAILVLEAAQGATPGAIIARIWQDGTHPTTGKGLPLTNGSLIEIIGLDNIQNTRIISVDGLAHKIQVQYFN
jgi:hypothetical protein